MRRFKQFLTEAHVYQEKYINGAILPLHPNPSVGKSDAVVGAISLLPGFSPTDKFQVISKETFEKKEPKREIEIPKGNTSNPLYVRQSNDEYYIKITGKSKSNIENAFYGGTSAGGLSGNEGELFWEYVSWLGVTKGDPQTLDDLLNATDGHLKAVSKIDSDKLKTVINSNSNFIKSIYKNSIDLRTEVNSTKKPDYVYARWDGLLIDNYYAYMKSNVNNYVRPNLKDNVADAVWIWGNDFIKSNATGLHFIPTVGSEHGLVDVWETPDKGKPIAQMLQVSLKKGKSDAQGGGTTDALKGMGVFDASMKSQLQDRAKAENIYIGVIDEGVVDYVKAGLQKAKNVFAKLFGYFDGLIKRVISAFEGKGKRQFFKFAKRAGIDKSMLTEGLLPERFEGISGHVLENDFNKLLDKIETSISDNVFTVVWGKEGIVRPDAAWFSEREKENSTDQQAALNYILINEVALWVIGNIASRSKTLDPSVLVREMADFIWDIKMGDTKLPVVQLYGDANKWDVLDRGKSNKSIEDINNYMENLKGLKFYPLVANIFKQKTGKPWNVTHLYIIKSMTIDSDEPEPVYFKMVLRGDGSTPKINSENDYYLWNKSGFVKYKG